MYTNMHIYYFVYTQYYLSFIVSLDLHIYTYFSTFYQYEKKILTAPV